MLTAAAGARRTDTAYPRLLSWANAARWSSSRGQRLPADYYAALAKLPQVAQLSTAVLYQVVLPEAGSGHQPGERRSPDARSGAPPTR